MVRRLASVLLLGCFLATLAVAAGHNHFEGARSCQSDACVLCTGALAAGPGAPVLAPAPLPQWERVLPYLLQLDHSGGAPPLA
jgi:hypothetical protein